MAVTQIRHQPWRLPGCSDECKAIRVILPGMFGRPEVVQHSPEAHEEFGRITSSPLGGAYVWTGALVVDRLRRTAAVDGHEIALTPREWSVLDYLAANLGRVCSPAEIVSAVWGDFYGYHILRVNMVRIRHKLGICADLIRTDYPRGYRLLKVAPIEAGPAPVQAAEPRPWARDWDRCRTCGTTERPHHGHGRCATCCVRIRRSSP